jgi:chromosome segregation ATPase
MKLDKSELNSLQNLKSSQEELIYKLGWITLQVNSLQEEIVDLKAKKEEIVQDIEEVEEKENDLRKSLMKKYGDVSIDIKTGEVTENEQ